MTDKLTLAVNHALNDVRLARARQMAFNPGMGLDAKRESAWCEYGFKEDLTFDDFYKLYNRSGIAHGSVNKLAGTCWQTNPEIIQGPPGDESRKETAWERESKKVFTHRFWRAFAEADKRRLVGVWSAILLHIRDGKQWGEPVVKGRGLAKISPVWRSSIKVKSRDANGDITMWQYTEAHEDGKAVLKDVHPDRVFILGDMSDDAIGFLEPGYNACVSLEKVEGGSGESFLKNAARQQNINFDKEVDFNNLASMYGVTVDELQERYNEAAREINRGNDTLLITQGAQVTSMVNAVSDPSPTYGVNLQTWCCSVDIPSRIIVGNQSGERASTEDNKYMNKRCQSRRNELSFDVEDMADKLIDLKVVSAIGEKTVVWDDLNEQTAGEMLDNAAKMSSINQTSLASGEQVFTVNEIRVAAGYEPGGGEPLPEDEEDGETEEEGEASNPARQQA